MVSSDGAESGSPQVVGHIWSVLQTGEISLIIDAECALVEGLRDPSLAGEWLYTDAGATLLAVLFALGPGDDCQRPSDTVRRRLRDGHLAGKEVIDAERFQATLRAALEANTNPDTVIIARTDARAPLGVEEAISRGRDYAEAGADVIFIEAPESVEEVERIAREIDAPLLLNVLPGGRTPQIPPGRLAELGFRIAIHPGVALGAVAQAAIGALSELASTSPIETSADRAGFFDLFDLTRWQQLGERYAAHEKAAP